MNNIQPSTRDIVRRKKWTLGEDEKLRAAINIHGTRWTNVAQEMSDCTPSQCCQRWKRIKPDSQKSRQEWTPMEDNIVRKYIAAYGMDWAKMTSVLQNRTGKQIRERFLNHINPNIKIDAWSQEEDLQIVDLYKKYGSKWTLMSKIMKGRPELSIKNRFYSHLRQKYLNMDHPYYKRSSKKDQIVIKQEEEPTPCPIPQVPQAQSRAILGFPIQFQNQQQMNECLRLHLISNDSLGQTFGFFIQPYNTVTEVKEEKIEEGTDEENKNLTQGMDFLVQFLMHPSYDPVIQKQVKLPG